MKFVLSVIIGEEDDRFWGVVLEKPIAMIGQKR